MSYEGELTSEARRYLNRLPEKVRDVAIALDTRSSTPFAPQTSRDIDLSSLVPADVTGVVGTLTVVNATSLGWAAVPCI
jgi:hypothetical protein